MKKNKKILVYLLLVLSFVLIGAGAYLYFNGEKKESNKVDKEDKEEQKEKVTPLLYEITKEGSNNKIYLLGSIHLGNINELELPQYLNDAYNYSEYLAFEILDAETKEDPSMFMFKNENDTINNHFSKETIDKIKNYLNKNNMMNSYNEKMNPFYYYIVIQAVGYQKSGLLNTIGVDQFFKDKGEKDNKKLFAVEKAEDQMNVLANNPDRLFEIMINDLIDSYEKNPDSLKKLYESWKKGTIKEDLRKEIEETKISNLKYSEEDRKLIEEYNKKMLADRDIHMTNKLIEYFNLNYKMLYIVGSAHVVGENGIVDQLQIKGYTVREVK